MTDAVAVTSRRREATRQKLLDAAAQVFAEVGLDAASVETICERAGFTRGAFYSNFESKDELFLEMLARLGEEQLAAVEDRLRELRTQALRDTATARAYLLWQDGMVDRIERIVHNLVTTVGFRLRLPERE